MREVTDVVQATARGTEETSTAATDLARQSATMQALVSEFRLAWYLSTLENAV